MDSACKGLLVSHINIPPASQHRVIALGSQKKFFFCCSQNLYAYVLLFQRDKTLSAGIGSHLVSPTLPGHTVSSHEY